MILPYINKYNYLLYFLYYNFMLLFISLNSFRIVHLKEKGMEQESDQQSLVKGKKIQAEITDLLSNVRLKSIAH
jgi:hypothetical protein